jgi:hypothetical protein
VLGLLVALLATGPAGVWPHPWLVAVVAVLAVAYAALPETVVGTVAVVVVMGWWGAAFRGGVPVEAVAGAAGLVAAHVAGILVSYGPPGMVVDAPTVRLWAFRAVGVLLAAPLTWLVAHVVRGEPEVPGVWVAGLAAGLLAAAAGGIALASEERTG